MEGVDEWGCQRVLSVKIVRGLLARQTGRQNEISEPVDFRALLVLLHLFSI